MRDNITNALHSGKHLAFFDANSIYWQIRFEPSTNGIANRIITCYKDATLDPFNQQGNPSYNPSLTTVKWRDNPVNQPENSLLGVMFVSTLNYPNSVPWIVNNANSWVYNGTGVNNGDSNPGLVGYEFDGLYNNGYTPSGLTILSNSPVTDAYGYNDIASGSIYTYTPSNALVFNAGTIQWSWRVDDNRYQSHGVDPRVQQMTQNILNTMIGTTPTPTPTQVPTSTPTPSPTPTASYQATILSDSPVAYWRLGELSGTQATDTSGHNYTGTYGGGVTLGAAGAINHDNKTAISSDGTGKVMLPALSAVTNFTIEGWTYLTDPTWDSANHYNNTLYASWSKERMLIRPGASNTSSYALGYFSVWLNGTEYALQPVNTSLTNTNQWVYWAMVRDGATLTVYRNGVQVGQRTDLPATAAANISGALLAQDATTYFLKGSLDEVAVYNTALSATRIQAHYNSAQ